MRLDLRGLSVDEVIHVVFDHPVEDDAWWWRTEFVLDRAAYAAQLESIFRNPEGLLARYSREQLDQGVWFLMSETEAGLGDLLWDDRIPWSSRARLIQSTVDLYKKLFAKDPLDTSAHMFWDALAYGYCVPTRHPKTNEEDRRVQEEMFVALRRILEIDNLACQLAALHGLGHLRHPETEKTVRAFLDRNPNLSEQNRKYAMACVAGKVQ